MLRKVVVGLVILAALAAGTVYFRAQAIFSSDLVRTSIEGQLSQALGQPVSIGSIGAAIFPRVTMVLSDVAIGNPARITLGRLDVGASTRALLSRRIERATLTVDQARIELPLPTFAIGGGTTPEADDDAAGVTIGSIEDIELNDVEIVSGGRQLRGNVRVIPNDGGLRIDEMALMLDGTPIDITGNLTSLDGPQGTLALRASTLDMLTLQTFASDFASGAGLTTTDASGDSRAAAPADPPPTSAMELVASIEAERATFGTLALSDVRGTATLTSDRLDITTMTFGLFEGRYSGTVELGLADSPTFRLQGELADVSLAALTSWAGQPDTMTGSLSGRLDATGRGTDPGAVLASTTGSARLEAVQGTIAGLELVRTIVVASSMRTGSTATTATGPGSEAFSRMGGTFLLGGGVARTDDLAFESNDVSMTGAGHVGLDGTNIDLLGRVQLSEALTAEAGRDLVRYTQEDGRVTVPVRITGEVGALSVQPEAADLLKRAITNRAVEETGNAIRRGLGGLFGR